MMQMETARTGGNGASGGYVQATTDFNPKSPSPQITAIHSEMAAITATVEAGFTLINEARKAAAASVSTNGKCHFNAIADDEANRLGALLRVRWPGPVVPGKPVPPTVAEIRRALEAYQDIGRAMIAALEAESALAVEWSERAAIAAWGLEQHANELRRCYPHGV